MSRDIIRQEKHREQTEEKSNIVTGLTVVGNNWDNISTNIT